MQPPVPTHRLTPRDKRALDLVRRWATVLLLLVGGCLATTPAAAVDLYGWVAFESRFFPQSPLQPDQSASNLSFSLRPEFYQDWNRGRIAMTLTPFFRYDQNDRERTHFDLREAFLLYVGGDWEVRFGYRTVFWGVTEAVHMVDIINQTDLVEGPDGEDKLGQPMFDFTWIQDFGTIEAYLLFGFRERTFAGPEGRFGPPLPVGDAEYQSSAGDQHIDWAVRWSHSLGMWDVGLSYFAGTSRDPLFSVGGTPETGIHLIPYYQQIQQAGMDLQATTGGWLWKFESIYRRSTIEQFFAVTGGFEYTFIGVWGSRIDVGMLGEVLYDDRGRRADVPFQNDVFVGTRFAFNDVQGTDLLVGAIVDNRSHTTLFRVEGSRRIGDRWRLTLDYRGIVQAAPTGPFYTVRKDDFFEIELARYF